MERICSTDGVVLYRSSLLAGAGVLHAFSTRIGGVSLGAFDSLNLGNPGGQALRDDPECIRENYRRLLAAAGFDGQVLARVSQVHGSQVVQATKDSLPDPATEADAIVTCDPQCAASVRVADCVPVLLASRDGRRVAAVHCGWRGVVAGIAVRAMQRLCDTECRPEDVLAAVGPGIGFEAFEVGTDVLAEFTRIMGEQAPIRLASGGKGFVDLKRALQMQLIASGVALGQIDVCECCTHANAQEFYSHRRERGLTGRMAAIISPARN